MSVIVVAYFFSDYLRSEMADLRPRLGALSALTKRSTTGAIQLPVASGTAMGCWCRRDLHDVDRSGYQHLAVALLSPASFSGMVITLSLMAVVYIRARQNDWPSIPGRASNTLVTPR